MTGYGDYMIIRSDNEVCLDRDLSECDWGLVHRYTEQEADDKVEELEYEGLKVYM